MRTWFITGINSGFGRALTENLLQRGDRVAGTVRTEGAVADLQSKYGASLWVATLELTDRGAIARTVDQAFADLGCIDVAVSNAGYGLFGAVEGLDVAQIVHQVETNLVAPICLAKAVVPHFRKQGGGRLLAVSSYGGQAAFAGASLYHASKWGLEGFMEAMAQELAPFNIGVTIVEPGGARTAFRASAGANLGARLESYEGTPAAMVHAVLADPARVPNGDPAKMAAAMIASAYSELAPRRLVLGSDAYQFLHRALGDRLAEIAGQEASARETDISLAQ